MLDNPPLLSPYILPWKVTDNTTENIAVLLVDSQGLTDHGANAALNDTIFGLSTLLSSYQIRSVYNSCINPQF